MIKNMVFLLSLVLAPAAVLAQTTTTTPGAAPQTYPNRGFANTNQAGVGGLSFSNGAGQNFTPEELASQLQNLRAAIDQTLPILSAFNQHASNSIAPGRQTVTGALSGIVSDALRRNRVGQGNTAGQSSFGSSNLLSILHSLVNTNSTGAFGASPSNAQDLIALQSNLESAGTLLQRLNVSPNPNPMATPSPQPYPGGNLSPTGR